MIGLNDTTLLSFKTIDSFLNTLDEKDVRLLLDLAKLSSVYRLGPNAECILINTFICKNIFFKQNFFNLKLNNNKIIYLQLLYTPTNIYNYYWNIVCQKWRLFILIVHSLYHLHQNTLYKRVLILIKMNPICQDMYLYQVLFFKCILFNFTLNSCLK